ncbi:MAG: hypothetical protein A2X64_08080 [Ignavibacteria bacterium GWF2_33_9]|nr:MAG: hypothetical protein A2X64_08080 [Ignavibacteria bacterium GWF2_33_9]
MNNNKKNIINSIYKIKILLKYLNIVFYVWVLIRAYIFDRHLSYMDYGDFFPLFFYSLYLFLIIFSDYLTTKYIFEKFKITNKLYLNFIGILFIILYIFFLKESIYNIYVYHDPSVAPLWESGEWKW